MIRIDNVTRSFAGPSGTVSVLQGVSMQVGAGEFVAIRGASGSGKSTLLLIAGGLLAPQGGTVQMGGVDLYAQGPGKRTETRAALAGFVFQEFHLVPYLDVTENVLAAARGKVTQETRRRATDLVDRFHLGHRRDHLPSQLSAGEQQRTAMARALINGPKVLLADEPTGNLDEDNARIVLDHMAAFAAAGGAVMLVTHDNNAAGRAGRVVRLEQGRIAA
jgi:putative ABC transport system ATP-binding protein